MKRENLSDIIVLKRDGTTQKFDTNRLYKAIEMASNSSNEDVDIALILNKVCHKIESLESVSVCQLQEKIEDTLMQSKYKKTARKFIEYRHDRDVAREGKSKLLLDIKSFLDNSNDDITRENANKDAKSVTTHRDLIAGITSKHYAITQLLPKDVANAHELGFIHVHDADYLLSPLTNCCIVNYNDMLENGFKIGEASIEQPNSIGVASTVLTQIIQAVASSQYGGQTIAHIDKGLAKYVKKSYEKLLIEKEKYSLPNEWLDEKIDKEVYDAMQSFLYQVNSLTTTNGQTPFISITLGSGTDYFERLITKNYLKVHEKGLGKDGVTPVFPKVIFMLEDGVNLNNNDINYDLKQQAMQCSVKRIYPDYISVPLNKKITGSTTCSVSPMGCRSFLPKYVDENNEEKYEGRFNMGVCSLNLPMIAMKSVKENKDFFETLYSYLLLAYKSQLFRIERLKGTKARQNPTLFMQGAIARLNADETIDKLFYNGYASISIGYIGLSECCSILNNNSKEFALEVLSFVKDKIDGFKLETNIGFSLYGTPSEGYTLRAATCFKKMFGNDVINKDYLTNSFHKEVWNEISPIEKWNYEEGFASISTGGNISYIEQPSLKNNLKAYESFIDYAYTKIPYFAINTPVDKCYKCGFEGEFNASVNGFECPSCGNNEEGTLSVVRRISGYLTSPNSRPANKGKQQEIIERVKHK
jgi:anaerobic ribonucleoside-triphosphate reductase